MFARTTQLDSSTWLLRLVDASLAMVVFFAPLFLGGRHPLGQLVFVSLVAVASLWWCGYAWLTEARWQTCSLHWVLGLGVLLVFAQLVPLSPSVLQNVSPGLVERLPLWTTSPAGGPLLGQWTTLTICPSETQASLSVLIAYGLLFVLLVQRISSQEDVDRLLRWVAMASVAMAVIGLGQALWGTEKYLGLYEHPYRSPRGAVTGSIANRNHFAHFLAMGLAPLLCWFAVSLGEHRRQRTKQPSFRASTAARPAPKIDRKSWAIAAGIAVVVAAGLLSASRGGFLALTGSLAISLVGLWRFRLINRRWLAPMTLAGLLVVSSLIIYGWQPAAQRFASLWSGSLQQIDSQQARQRIWTANLAAAAEFPLAGTGAGTHRYVYPMYFPGHLGVEFTHAENGYLQVLTESGIMGLLLVLAIVGLLCRAAWRAMVRAENPTAQATAVAATASLVISAMHSLVDFVWFIPACMTLAIVAAACLCRMGDLFEVCETTPTPATGEAGGPRHLWAFALVALLIVAGWMVRGRVGPALASRHWDAYLKASMALSEADETSPPSATDLDQLQQYLEQVLQWQPQHPRARLRLADVHLRRFALAQQHAENAIGLPQIRDAAIASQFPSRQQLDHWLNHAIGPPRANLDAALSQSHLAATACPLQGEAYENYSRLAFLLGSGDETATALMQQALRTRPNSARVCMAAATDAAIAGDLPQAIEHWKIAYHYGPRYQQQITATLAPLVPAEQFITHLEPTTAGLGQLFHFYRRRQEVAQAKVAALSFATRLQNENYATTSDKVKGLRQAVVAYQYLRDRPAAAACAKQAADMATEDRKLQLWCVDRHVEAGEMDAAIQRLQQCVARRPGDVEVRQRLQQIYQAKRDSSLGHQL